MIRALEEDTFTSRARRAQRHGPSFPYPIDVYIDVKSGEVKVHSEKAGEGKDEELHLDIPEDVATGMMETLLKNISPSTSETSVSMVTTSDKPRVVKLKIHSDSERQFWTGGYARKAIDYVIHVDIGVVAGQLHLSLEKQPPDTHIWVLGGKAPTFVKFEGRL